MKTVHVRLGQRSYDILIAPHLLQRAAEILKEHAVQKRIFLIANKNVFRLHGKPLVDTLAANGFDVTEIFIPDGEQFKTLHTLETIYTYLIAQRADRLSTIAALGGGVTGDIAGFVAATFLRGISYVQIPTTLLAQVDSSVGGKTGVNHPNGKNMIGVFHQPSLVCIDTGTLSTLPDREYRSGLYEVLKYGLIYDREFFEYLETHIREVRNRAPEVLERVIGRCCEIKAEITSLDERERDLRRILNFGHTYGHALEVVSGFQGITHGEAVAYGMIAATQLSHDLGYLAEDDCRRVLSLIGKVGDLPPVEHASIEDLIEAMDRDKKRLEDRKFFVLLRQIGKTDVRGDVDDRRVREAWKKMVLLPQA
ncbi:MAG: 3-dehydroquinate synthase [Acidobacteriota bacterium]